MESSSSGKAAGSRCKTPGIPASTRMQRNLAEKERRDKLNGFISELATLIPMVSNAAKPLDKVSILRLAAAEMRLHFSCLNPKKYKKKPLVLPPEIMGSLDLIEKTTGGFIIATTLTGLIVFCSRSIEDYLGYQNIDVMGNKAVKYIYDADVKYFEHKFASVVNSLKKTKKKTKVFKTHMLQKPLPRSSETCRPRNMTFKISVHQNDTSEKGGNNGSNSISSNTTKIRPQKDFGYSAVVLMFIEPVRFEPEIDITYIDSNQDIYFTRHGLQGEIIYADQHISTITGYMPHDVTGTSAYQYICSSDIPLALFAQKAMFTSPDGKGVIVYRLRIRDMRYIYLQSSGQIVYKESSTELSHFVCFNRLLSEEEGSQELKKFQQRYAPQIMAAKMLQDKQNPGNRSPTTDLAYEQVMKLINSSPATDAASSSPHTNSVPCTDISTPDVCSDIVDQNETRASPSSFLIEPSFEHSSENHSVTSPTDNVLSISTTVCSPTYVNEEQMDVVLEMPEQRLGGGPLRRKDCDIAFSSSPYKAVINDRKGKVLSPEQFKSCLNELEPAMTDETFYHSVNSPSANGTNQIYQNRQYVSVKSQNGNVNFANVHNCPLTGSNSLDPDEARKNQSMLFDKALSQTISLHLAASIPHVNGQYNSLITEFIPQQREYLRREDEVSKNNWHLSGLVEAEPNILCDQQNFNGDQNPTSSIPIVEGSSSLSRMYDMPHVSSLLQNSNLSVLSDQNGVDYPINLNSYPEIDCYNNYHFPSSINNYKNGANISICSGIDNLSKTVNVREMNQFHEAITSLDECKTDSPIEIFDSINKSVEMTAFNDVQQKTAQNNVDFMEAASVSGIMNSKKTITVNHINNPNGFSSIDGHGSSSSANWDEILSNPINTEGLPLNKELYSELNTFFQNLPQLNTSQASTVAKGSSEFPSDSSTCKQHII